MDGDLDQPSASHRAKRLKTHHATDSWRPEPRTSSPTHEQYTIAWICALHIELAAACAMLDDIHDDLPTHMNDSNTYKLGSIKHHNIVIACLPTGQYGTINAANVMAHLVRTFPSIHLSLMVGIGGGVPRRADIRLGDIVVGTRVMQHDLGKLVGGQRIQTTASGKSLSRSVGAIVSNLQAKHEREPSQVPSIMQQKLEGYTEYSLPTSPDRLFQASYDHEVSMANCDSCDQTKLVPRSSRKSGNPTIHYGAIASGNQVVKHGITRDDIARRLDVICFEMETAGVMDDIPCLPIRGICDYSDSHKNDAWQRYAAATAAAYAREFLEELSAVTAYLNATTAPKSHQDLSHDYQRRFLESLRFEQIDARKATITSAHAKTCRWFLNHENYKAWLDPTRLAEHCGFLWIRGKPGAGKSTIMKFAFDSLRKAPGGRSNTASFFFNARGEYLERSILGMYRSLLFQLLKGYPDIQTGLDQELIAHCLDDCSLIILMDLFRSAVNTLGQRPFTCFIDALDECDEQQIMHMVDHFEELAEGAVERGIPLRICFSSRHYPYIDIRLGIALTLEDQRGHTEDLSNYVDSKLRIKDRELLEELRPQILTKAAGVFLWVVLVLEILNKEHRRGGLALKKRLAEVPNGLSELFRSILTRDNEDMEALLLCLLWVLYAKRPLRPAEYFHALWSGLCLKGLVDPDVPDVTDASERVVNFVVSSSKGLTEITRSKSPTVQFIHESVRDFLIKDKGLLELWPDLGFNMESPSHERLKQCCNLYINHHSVYASVSELPPESTDTEQPELKERLSFLEYASQYILYHANAAADAVPQDNFLSELHLPNWTRTISHLERVKARWYSTHTSLLYVLADRGFAELIRTWLKTEPYDGMVNDRYEYPLFAALANGHKDAVAALLGSSSHVCDGIDIMEGLEYKKDLKGYRGRTPLSWAAQDGRIGIVKLLLKKGTSISEADRSGRTSIFRASENGHEAMVALLIEKGADANATVSGFGYTPLIKASENGHKAVAALLIEKGADINAANTLGDTPLMKASKNGHKAVAALLIEKGADSNATDILGDTSLIKASENGQEAMAALLIEKGADFNAAHSLGYTPLMKASENGHRAVAALLIEKGADVNADDHWGQTPLMKASQNGHEAVAALLIEKGAAVPIMEV